MPRENKKETKKPKACWAMRQDGSLCGRTLYDDKHCIFHSEDIEGKKKVFNDAFWKEFKRQRKEDEVYDFYEFIFPSTIDFVGINFEKTTHFTRAKFLGKKTNFSNAKFLDEYTFFNYVEFLGKEIFFTAAYFLATEDTWFLCAKFLGEKTDFTDTTFSGKLTSFSSAEFLSKLLIFDNANFLAEKTVFDDAKFFNEKIWLYNSYFQNLEGLFEALREKMKFLKRVRYKIKDFRFRLGEESATRYPLINRMTKDAWFLADFQGKHPRIFKIWKLTSNCGRSILLWAVWSLGIAVIFALIYMLLGESAFKPRNYTWFSWFYYSIVTFTTLGFGDITPIKWFSEVLVTIEVIFGYIMLGGLISIFANKLARRS